MILKKGGFYLYIWLALFALFISFFGIILFNYVGADIKATRSIYQDSRLYYDIKSILVSITEIYRESNFNSPNNPSIRRGRYEYKNVVKRYQVDYEINPLNSTHLLIEIRGNNNLRAKGIVKWRENISDFALITAKNNEEFKSNSFYSSAAIFSNTITIPETNRFIFNKVLINENTIVNGIGQFNNLQEMQKFAQFIEINNSLNDIIQYYNQLSNEVHDKIVTPLNSTYTSQYSNAGNVVLTPYGGIYIKQINTLQAIKINFSIQNGNQIIEFLGIQNNNITGRIATFKNILQEPDVVTLQDGNEVISNDNNIINNVRSRNPYIVINPISKILQHNDLYTIYTNLNTDNTIIYSEMPLEIGSDGPGNSNNATINTKIMIITPNNITIKNNILYSYFNNLSNYINLIQNNNTINMQNSNNLLRIIANNIIFDTSEFQQNDNNRNTMCLNGQFVAMFSLNSHVIINNPNNISNFLIFGSLQASQRINFVQNFQERYILDGRLTALDPTLSIIIDNIDNSIYLNKVSVLGIEILSK